MYRHAGMKVLAPVAIALAALGVARVDAEDWPTYLHDIRRSCVTAERLAPPLANRWTRRPMHKPDPAWPLSQWNEAKTVFDRAYHPVIAKGRLYFGSSADGKVYCLDAATGKTLWAFYTSGPVRIAPTVANEHVYVTSDDGRAYCLRARDGTVVWSVKGAPGTRRVLGNGKIISLWPMRTGVLVDGNVAYFAAGLFPSEGVYIYAVDAKTGRALWTNDAAGAIYMLHGHGGYDGFAGISPQGALLADPERLFVPMGRNVPAALDRRNGRIVFWRYLESHRLNARDGGSAVSLTDGVLFTSPGNTYIGTHAGGYDPVTGDKLFDTRVAQLIVTPDRIFMLDRSSICAADRNLFKEQKAVQKKLKPALKKYLETWPKPESNKLLPVAMKYRKLVQEIERKNRRGPAYKWRFKQGGLEAMILAGDMLFAGAKNLVVAVDTKTGAKLWQAPVEGAACGLAVSDGRLFVSTDQGVLHCFDKKEEAKGVVIARKAVADPYDKDALTKVYSIAAEAIVNLSGINRGYCLVIDGGTGRLACELARRTELQVYCLVPRAEQAKVARRLLDEAGLYGGRVMVDVGTPRMLPYPHYFANLIVSDGLVVSGKMPAASDELVRVLKPWGGTILMGCPIEAPAKIGKTELQNWLKLPPTIASEIIEKQGIWLKLTRGAVPGAGEWTHQFANPAGTGCSEDKLARGPFEILWFGKPGPAKTYKANTPCPLSTGGRIFVAKTPVQAYDAFNGLPLWEAPVKDVSLFAATEESLYVSLRKSNRALRLDAATGETLKTFTLPKHAGVECDWAFLAVKDDLLFGSGLAVAQLDPPDVGRQQALFDIPDLKKELQRRSMRIRMHCSDVWHFAQTKWKGVLAEIHTKLKGVSQDRVAKYVDRIKRAIAGSASHFLCSMDRKTGKVIWTYEPGKDAYIVHSAIAIADGRVFLVRGLETPAPKTPKHLVALDMKTGRKLWETSEDLRTYGRAGTTLVDSTEMLALACKDDILVLAEIFGGRGLYALSADDGRLLWKNTGRFNNWQNRRPLVVGGGVYTDYDGFDLKTGKTIMRKSPITDKPEPWQYERSGGCGGSTASACDLFFRSSSISYFDLHNDHGITNLSGIRPGCWMNIVPAAGLALVPEQTQGCVCAFPIKASVVLRPTDRHRAWSLIKLNNRQLPVEHMALNLGAPGDRRGPEGMLWLGYPRPKVGHGYKFELPMEIAPGLGFFGGPPDGAGIEAEDKPWVYASGCCGLKKITIPLSRAAADESLFRVRLFFSEPILRTPGGRVFDIKLQGRFFERDFDILKVAGQPKTAVVKTYTLKLRDSLNVEFVPKAAELTVRNAPILNGFTVERVR